MLSSLVLFSSEITLLFYFSAFPSTKKDVGVAIAHAEETSSDIHSLIGISLVLGFVFMLLVDQCSASRSRGMFNLLDKKLFIWRHFKMMTS